MPEQTLDTAIADLGAAAEHALEPVVASRMDAFAARGHQIISENLERAKTLAATYPAVGALLPVIEGTLRSLFAHMLAGPDAVTEAPPSRDETRDTVKNADGTTAPAAHMTPEAASADLTAASTETGAVAVNVDPTIAVGDPSNPNQTPSPEASLPFPPIRDDKVPAVAE